MYIRFYCDECGQTWEVYKIGDTDSDVVRACPHCGARIGRDIWIEKVIPAIRAADDANKALYDSYPLFTMSCIANNIRPVQLGK